MDNKIKNYLYIEISRDRLTAELHCNDEHIVQEAKMNRDLIKQLLRDNNVKYGIDEVAVSKLLNNPNKQFPITIARGNPAIRGEDGKIKYEFNFSTEVKKKDDWNFRDVMRIPSVKEGQKLATLIPPSKGENGIDVFNNIIQAKSGKPFLMKPGKNVKYSETDHAFYATIDGQVSLRNQSIEVQSIYEVHDDLSMEVGNLDFVGSIIIHGDVPTGFKVKAKGDIHIFGIVEAAEIISGGSVYISEGFAGLKKGTIKAEDNVHVGYINQGIVQAGGSIYVENSILHSKCEAGKDIFCQYGNIIGGTLLAGGTIEAKDIGNRLNIKTTINLKIDTQLHEQGQQLLEKKNELEATLKNLALIGEKLAQQKIHDEKIKQVLLRQKNSHKNTVEQLNKINNAITQINLKLENTSGIIVNNYIYPNSIISFGRYQRVIQANHRAVRILLEKNEIIINSL